MDIMNILFITDNYPPEYNAAAIRTSEHINRWAETNNNITVITCFPNFPKGKIFEGFKNKLYKVERNRNISTSLGALEMERYYQHQSSGNCRGCNT